MALHGTILGKNCTGGDEGRLKSKLQTFLFGLTSLCRQFVPVDSSIENNSGKI